ncbi:MAG: HAMP domain-containing protein [Gloeotrichia echinulata GP01]
MELINANTRTTIMLCIIALIVAMAVAIQIVRWITQPVLALNKSANALAQGEWEKRIKIWRSDELGELVKSFNSMAHQLKATFLEMQTLNKTLCQSESRLQQFLEAVPVPISIYDSTGQFYYANRTAKQLFSIERLAEVKSEELAQLYQVYLAESDQSYPIAQLPIVGSLADQTIHVDNLELRQEQKIIPVEVLSTPIFDETGKIAYAIAAFIDITERKQAQKLLADYNTMLEQQVAESTLELQAEIAKRKQAEQALQESEMRLRLLSEATFEPLVITDTRRSLKALPSLQTSTASTELLEDSDLQNALHRFATQMFSTTNTCIICQVIGEIYSLSKVIQIRLNQHTKIRGTAVLRPYKYHVQSPRFDITSKFLKLVLIQTLGLSESIIPWHKFPDFFEQ